MPRLARVVAIDYPHHVVQRGNRRQQVFFNDQDRKAYLKILALQSQLFHLEVWAYCLMRNHVHLIVVPRASGSLTNTIGETHKLYTRMINFREKWRGYLWEGRFKSVVMEERYLYAAVRYVERNPVRVGIVKKAEDYVWSSARTHVENREDEIVSRFYLSEEIADWRAYLADMESESFLQEMRRSSKSGRPIGSQKFLAKLERLTGRLLVKMKPGPIKR